MSTTAQNMSRMSRPVKKLEKPRPLKIQNQNRHSTIDARLGTLEDIMTLTDAVASTLANGNYDRALASNISNLSNMLKSYGTKLEAVYKDQLDRAFVTFRNGCRDERLDYMSRLQLLQLIELRAMQWSVNDNDLYYKHKFNHQDIDVISLSSFDSTLNNSNVFQNTQTVGSLSPQPLLLGPGELVKSSGKFAAPTKIPGKNYCKDEVVIRNSDSGKVMGIKGRRVHMIEELSETVISFQRVNPGAKERLVQITGPTEDKIVYAKQLMEETIRRNASPVRSEMPDKERLGSSSSLNSSTSDDSLRYRSSSAKRSTLLHSFSTNDANLGEYKYTVTVGDNSLKITGSNLDLVRIAKLVLDEYFGSDGDEQTNEYGFEEENVIFEPVHAEPILRVNSQDSEESEETYKVQTKTPIEIKNSQSFKTSPQVNVNPSKPENEMPEEDDEDDSIFFKEVPPISEEEMKVLSETESCLQTRKGITRVAGSKATRFITYTAEELLHYANSPLSKQIPENWLTVMRDLPAIVKKLPIDVWFDSKSYLRKRLQESDAIVAIQSLTETGSPETE